MRTKSKPETHRHQKSDCQTAEPERVPVMIRRDIVEHIAIFAEIGRCRRGAAGYIEEMMDSLVTRPARRWGYYSVPAMILSDGNFTQEERTELSARMSEAADKMSAAAGNQHPTH